MQKQPVNKFHCSHCGASLSPNGDVILVAKAKKEKKGLLLLSNEIGNYNYVKDSTFSLKIGEKVLLECPLCFTDLQSLRVKDFSEIIVHDGKRKGTILFSSINGVHATLIEWEDGSKEAFGPDKAKFAQFMSDSNVKT